MAATIQFRCVGPEQDQLAAELARRLTETFGVEPAPAPHRPPAKRVTRGADPVAVAAMILAIPGAVAATVDLAQRARLIPKLRQLIAWARELRRANPQSRIEVTTPDGRTTPLDEMEPAGLLRVHPEREPRS